MKTNKILNYLFLTCLSLGTLSGCKVEVIAPVEKCIVTFNTNGGPYIPNQELEKGDRIQEPEDPIKEGHTFINWTYQGREWDFFGYTVSEDMTLDANYDVNSYNLHIDKNINEAGKVFGEGTYEYGEYIRVREETKPGYKFLGWYKYNKLVSTYPTYSFNMPSRNVSYEARYTANSNISYKVEHYLQNINNDEYTLFETDKFYGTTGTLTEGKVNTYEGFTSPSITQTKINGDGSTVIKLYYTRNTYNVSLNTNNSSACEITGSGSYKYGKKVTISVNTKPGYTFNGLYEDDKLVSSEEAYIFTMPARNVSYEARYTANKYIITLNNEAEGVTISGITSGNAYDCGTSITLTASNIPSGYIIRWERSDGIIRYGDSYSFIVPSKNVTITITVSFPLYTRIDDKIYFGEYPQTEVKDTSLIDELNTLAGTKPTSSNTYNWTDYNYYVNGSISSYMFYQDIDIDSDGTYDYRGVYFTQYRPYWFDDSSSYTYQDDNGYLTNTIYWFSYETIEWNILQEENGKALLIANLILDSQEYYPSNSFSMFEHNGGNGYANNYELSNIRKFLNDNFYNTAFNELQKEIIETTLVDNSAESTANKYACNDTNDKMFLLSYKEVTTYYSSSSNRTTHGSDYAKSQGLYVSSSNENSYWWLRSPSDYGRYSAIYVDSYGYVNCNYVYNTHYGVRAACQIILQ